MNGSSDTNIIVPPHAGIVDGIRMTTTEWIKCGSYGKSRFLLAERGNRLTSLHVLVGGLLGSGSKLDEESHAN